MNLDFQEKYNKLKKKNLKYKEKFERNQKSSREQAEEWGGMLAQQQELLVGLKGQVEEKEQYCQFLQQKNLKLQEINLKL